MTVWETVVAGSTLASGTFWEHLNAQQGGGTGPGETQYILVDSFVLECDMPEFELSIEDGFDIEVETEEFDLEVEDTEFQLEVD